MLMEVESATVDLSGITAQYSFDYPISMDSSDDFNRITLGTLNFEASVVRL